MALRRTFATRVFALVAGFAAISSFAQSQRVMTTFAGSDWVFSGDGKPAVSAPLGLVYGLTTDKSGKPVLVDNSNCIAARLETNATLSVIAGNGICGLSFAVTGDGGPATAAGIFSPYAAAYDPAGNLYVLSNNLIRKISNGVITHFAGTGSSGFSGDGGPATLAMINSGGGIASDANGNIYFTDNFNNRVRKISTSGIITTFAGNGTGGSAGDGGQAANANLLDPEG